MRGGRRVPGGGKPLAAADGWRVGAAGFGSGGGGDGGRRRSPSPRWAASGAAPSTGFGGGGGGDRSPPQACSSVGGGGSSPRARRTAAIDTGVGGGVEGRKMNWRCPGSWADPGKGTRYLYPPPLVPGGGLNRD
jgi:hypothetical protein